MGAEYMSTGLPLQVSMRREMSRRWTLELAVAGAFLVATAELGMLQRHPEAASPPDAIALVSFGHAALEQLPGSNVVSHPTGAVFDFRQRVQPNEATP